MNFDELQKQWDNQSSEEVKIDPNLELNQEANTIIDNVRKTLKKDFFFQITTFPLLLSTPYLFEVNNQLIWWIMICYCATLFVPLYYIFRFYKKSYRLEYNSLKNLNWFYYNYKSSIEVYYLYTLIFCILMIMYIGIINIQKENEVLFSSINGIIRYSIVLIFYLVFCIYSLKWWINKLYKKKLVELENILHQLEE